MINRRLQPPIDENMLEFHLPNAAVNTLPNGLTVISFERSDIPKIYYRVGLLAGEKLDPQGLSGSMDMMSTLMKKGTRSRNYQQFVEEIDFTGGSLGASTSKDFFYGYGEFLSEFAETGLELLADMFCNPVFPEKEVALELERAIVNLENEKSSSAYIGRKFMARQLYSPHAYGNFPDAETLAAINPQGLQQLHQANIKPSGSFVVIAGNISEKQAMDLAAKAFSNWQGTAPIIDLNTEPIYVPDVLFIDRPGSVQSSVSFGVPLFARKDERYSRTLVSNQILGGGSSGRLFLTLREEKGLTYGAYSSLDVYCDTGSWIASAEVRSDSTGEAIDGFLDEFARMRDSRASAAELQSAKRYLAGAFPMRCETPSGMANLFLLQSLYGFSDNYWNRYLDDLETVTVEDVQQTAQEFLTEQRMQIVVVGDAETVIPQLGRFETLRVVDIEGNEKSA
ncbi:MAG: M16 family metallopeptidase [Calditrichia bacterium]